MAQAKLGGRGTGGEKEGISVYWTIPMPKLRELFFLKGSGRSFTPVAVLYGAKLVSVQYKNATSKNPTGQVHNMSNFR